MNNVILAQSQKMSSREIAMLCHKSHDNVLKLVRSLIQGGIVKSTTPHQYVHPQNGQTYTEYLSDKRDSLVIVARLSPEFTAAVIDRWQELENAQPRLPSTYIEALEALLISEKAKLELEAQAKLNAPKVRHYDRVANRTNLLNATQVGLKIGLSAVSLNKHLDELGVYNKSIKRNKRTFNHWFVERGFGRMIQGEMGYDQAMFTHQGEAWVIEQLTTEGVA